jgi:hypothetical protein
VNSRSAKRDEVPGPERRAGITVGRVFLVRNGEGFSQSLRQTTGLALLRRGVPRRILCGGQEERLYVKAVLLSLRGTLNN